ncbi:MAG: transcriptional regulator NrdR [Oscillospiraceae bacterium]|nr:transcriptional regulator NrdR [Oscillospiraceae bacterium]
MRCPFCGHDDSKVIDSRPTDEGERIRRRRECLLCNRRFTTYEVIDTIPLIVVKRDRSREPFDRNKLVSGFLRACVKRPVSIEQIDRAIDEIESNLHNSLDRETTSDKIGDRALEQLKKIDDVAYIRFASVYKEFSDIPTFMSELEKFQEAQKGAVTGAAKT